MEIPAALVAYMNVEIASIVERLRQYRWGAWCLVSLYVSIASGILVGLQYDPATPYYSVAALDLLVPFGAFFRSVHFYSSQAFFLFGCAHLVAIYHKTDGYSAVEWVMLVCSLVVGLLLLFTGYILRGDNTGFSAGMIAEAIMKTIPLIGTPLNTVLFAITERGMQRVYVHHVITLDALWLMLVWNHLRRYRVRVTDHIPLISLMLGGCLLLPAPIEPDRLGVTYISGPWFFLGLQELLRYLNPLFAGVIFPTIFLAILLLARKGQKYLPILLRCIACWLVLYSLLTSIAWLR